MPNEKNVKSKEKTETKSYKSYIERTCVILKPDAVQRCLVGKIIERFENAGLKIVGMKMVWIDSDFSKKHYEPHLQKPFYKFLERMMTEGPVIAMVIEGVHAVEIVRKLIGATEPKSAMPGTIRGDFAMHSYEYADSKESAIKNLVHASDSIESAKKEIQLWFSEKEVHTYKTVHEIHVF